MTRKWSPPRIMVIDSTRVKFGDDLKDHIAQELFSFGIEETRFESFIQSLELAAAGYFVKKKQIEETTPQVVKKNLKKVIKTAEKLSNEIITLDSNAKGLILEAIQNGFPNPKDSANEVIPTLKEALSKAEQYPSSGRIPDYATHHLVQEVSDAISTHLGVKPNTTREGLFESILIILLGAVKQKQLKSAHSLIEKIRNNYSLERL